VILLDASALIALLRDEPGAAEIERAMLSDGAAISAANYSETLQKVVQYGGDLRAVSNEIEARELSVEPVTAEDGVQAAALWLQRSNLSLGDRLCLAVAARLECEAYTTDATWSGLPHAHVVER
jgi:ribonuclease VapC